MKNCFISPPHLTGVSTLCGETGNPEIVFSHKCCILFCQRTVDAQNTLKDHLVTVKPSFIVKTIHAPDRTYRKKIGKARHVTYMLHDYHARRSVGRCVKNGSYSSPNLE